MGMRPVLVFGALADQVVASLMESYPHMFYCCRTGTYVVGREHGAWREARKIAKES